MQLSYAEQNGQLDGLRERGSAEGGESSELLIEIAS